jgi:hypothetical protein
LCVTDLGHYAWSGGAVTVGRPDTRHNTHVSLPGVEGFNRAEDCLPDFENGWANTHRSPIPQRSYAHGVTIAFCDFLCGHVFPISRASTPDHNGYDWTMQHPDQTWKSGQDSGSSGRRTAVDRRAKIMRVANFGYPSEIRPGQTSLLSGN